MSSYWVAHTRGPNFDTLKERGFVTFYPTMDDYVFLEKSDVNKPLLRKQTELGVFFLREKDRFVEISEKELTEMSRVTVDLLVKGSELLVLVGTYENLEGTIEEDHGEELTCQLQGFNRTYQARVKKSQVVSKPRVNQILTPFNDPLLEA